MKAPLDIEGSEFRRLGHELIDAVADHFEQLREKRVTPGQTPGEVRRQLHTHKLPDYGLPPEEILRTATSLLMNNSLFAGHPRFWGYIIGSGTQIGTLADLLAATINPNVGGWEIAPMASEIERQVVGWIRDWISFPQEADGILVSGGAMANYVGFLVGRRVKGGEKLRSAGLKRHPSQLKVYCSDETHTWIQKATDLFGLGTDAIAWIPTNDDLKMNVDELRCQIEADIAAGLQPFMIIGTAGSVSTGVVDNLAALAALCQEFDLWFHVDGAYGGPAAGLEQCRGEFDGFWAADSVALDPHKWFYCPQEAGCAIVRDKQHLLDTFSYRPPYYHFEDYEDEPGVNYYEYGLQNSRGFRALKVWMSMLQAGNAGLNKMIAHDIAMAALLFDVLADEPDFVPFNHNLSIATFQYVPDKNMNQETLNDLNQQVMARVQVNGDAFITNAVVQGKYLMRACFVNFRTNEEDVRALPAIIRKAYDDLRGVANGH